jgi:transposase
VISCDEAGRDAFWLHRSLASIGVNNLVVDSARIEVNHRAKQAKTDTLDLDKLLTMRMRYEAGEKKVWQVVHVPGPEVEDHRHLHRELADLKAQRTQHTNRIHPQVVGHGCLVLVGYRFGELLSLYCFLGGRYLDSESKMTSSTHSLLCGNLQLNLQFGGSVMDDFQERHNYS